MRRTLEKMFKPMHQGNDVHIFEGHRMYRPVISNLLSLLKFLRLQAPPELVACTGLPYLSSIISFTRDLLHVQLFVLLARSKVICAIRRQRSDEDEAVEANTHTTASRALARDGARAGLFIRFGIAGLVIKFSTRGRADGWMYSAGRARVDVKTYLSPQDADLKAFQDLARFVTMSHVFKCLRRILSTDIKENLLTTTVNVQLLADKAPMSSEAIIPNSATAADLRVLVYEGRSIVNLVVHHDKEILLAAVLRNIGV